MPEDYSKKQHYSIGEIIARARDLVREHFPAIALTSLDSSAESFLLITQKEKKTVFELVFLMC